MCIGCCRTAGRRSRGADAAGDRSRRNVSTPSFPVHLGAARGSRNGGRCRARRRSSRRPARRASGRHRCCRWGQLLQIIPVFLDHRHPRQPVRRTLGGGEGSFMGRAITARVEPVAPTVIRAAKSRSPPLPSATRAAMAADAEKAELAVLVARQQQRHAGIVVRHPVTWMGSSADRPILNAPCGRTGSSIAACFSHVVGDGIAIDAVGERRGALVE